MHDEFSYDVELPIARIVVSGDQPIMRAGVRRLVESDPRIIVLGECANRPEALAKAVVAKPNLVLMDLNLSARGFGALERIGALLGAAHGTPVLILTASEDCAAMQYALHHGAIGLVLKHRPPGALTRAIRAGVAGEMCLDQTTMAALFGPEPNGNGNGHGNGHDSGDGRLTAREREIISLVALGLHNKAIAQRLRISDTTVRHHLTSVFEKLSLSNRLELMRYVFAAGETSELDEPVAAIR